MSPPPKSSEPDEAAHPQILDPLGSSAPYGTPSATTADVQEAVKTKRRNFAGRPRKGETPEQARLRRAVEQFHKQGGNDGANFAPTAPAEGESPIPSNPGTPIPSPAPQPDSPPRALTPRERKVKEEASDALAGTIVTIADSAIGRLAEMRGIPADVMKATPEEISQLRVHMAVYLASQDVQITPGWALIIAFGGVYGTKLPMGKEVAQ